MNTVSTGIFSLNSRYNQNSSDPITFESKKKQKPKRKHIAIPLPTRSNVDTYTPIRYNTTLSQPLEAYKQSGLDRILLYTKGVYKPTVAAKRVQSFSNYLKKMVGFIPPAAIDNKQWFELGCTYLIKGAAGVNIPEEAYSEYAKKLWNLISKADPYWTSDEFINYLETINNNKGVQATIDALKELKPGPKNMWNLVSFTGNYISDLRYIPELLKTGCAYSGTPLDPTKYNKYPTLEHIFPHIEGTDFVNTDYNYVLTLGAENNSRGCIPLVAFLQGWDASEFDNKNPDWKQKLIADLKQQYNITDSDFIPQSQYKSSLPKSLKADPNPKLKSELSNDRNIYNMELAATRIKSLSRYLKEDMVGFITQDGTQWLEEGCTNLIKATAGTNIPEIMYEEYAKDFWGLMAKADSYWTSPEFIQFLESINTNPGVKTTIKVIQDLKIFKEMNHIPKRRVAFAGKYDFAIPDKIMNDGCAYSNSPFVVTNPSQEPIWKPLLNPYLNKEDESLEKISNFVLTTKTRDMERADMPLSLYLRGWNEEDYRQANKNWRKHLIIRLEEKYRDFVEAFAIKKPGEEYVETNPAWQPILNRIMQKNRRSKR